MYDQLIIGDKNSYDDFGASLASRKIDPPAKKKVRETIPFSNITYDFSKINGEFYYEDRSLEYTLEMTAETPQELEDMKTALSDWIMNVFQEELHDPFIPDYHFIATYDGLSFSDDEGMNKTTAAAKFTAYPFKIANINRAYSFQLPEQTNWYAADIENNSSHPVTAIFELEQPISQASGDLMPDLNSAVTVRIDGKALTFYGSAQIKLGVGLKTLYITCLDGGELKVSFAEEVL